MYIYIFRNYHAIKYKFKTIFLSENDVNVINFSYLQNYSPERQH